MINAAGVPDGLAAVTVDVSSAVSVATVSGELDLGTVPDVRARLKDSLDAATGGFIVDVRDVTFSASVGLAMLVELSHHATVPFVVVANQSAILRPLSLLGLEEEFVVCADIAAARQAAGAPVCGE